MSLFYTLLLTFIINLPFGYFRAKFQKFTLNWFLMIHIPVPFVVFIRYSFGISFSWTLLPFLVGSFFLGQFVGRMIFNYKIL